MPGFLLPDQLTIPGNFAIAGLAAGLRLRRPDRRRLTTPARKRALPATSFRCSLFYS